MGFNTPKAVARIGTYTQLTKSRVEDAHDAQWHRATARYQVAQYAAALRAEGRSLRATTKLVLTGIKTNLFLMDRAPSHETIRKLSDAWNAGRTSIGDYFDEPRTGRPAVTSTKLVDIIKLAVRVQDYASISSLHVRVTTEAARLGVSVPSYDTVKKLVANQGRVARSAAAHGAKAAQLDAMPHSTVPVVRPHDAWVLDEFDAPFYAKIYDSDVEEWVSVRPSIITIADHFSGAIVGHWVADPARRRDAETRRIMRAGFDVKDVLGALLSAAWGQALACPGTANFTGFLPQALRWDNHKTHGSLRPILTELGKRLVLEIGSFYAEHQDAPTTSWSTAAATPPPPRASTSRACWSPSRCCAIAARSATATAWWPGSPTCPGTCCG